MNAAAILALLESATPAIRDVVVTLIQALNQKDEPAVRKATEAALRLAFEARQGVL